MPNHLHAIVAFQKTKAINSIIADALKFINAQLLKLRHYSLIKA
jgi:hypothetical protein